MASTIELVSSNRRGQNVSDIAVESGAIESPTFQDSSTHYENALPPADEGKDAWLFLLTCFVVEAFVWGMNLPCSSAAASRNLVLTLYPCRISIFLWCISRVLHYS